MSLGRLNNSLYDERGQFIGNQQPEANMFYGFNPTGAIGTGVSSGNVPAVANPLDSAPAGGGKGGGKGGGFTPPPPQNMYGGAGYNTYMGAGGIRPTSTPAFTSGFTSPAMMPSQGKGGGKGGGTPPPTPAMSAGTGKGGGKGGGMPPPPAPASGGKGGGIGEMSDYLKEAAGRIGQPRTPPPSDMQAPPAGGGMFGGLANAANLVNQQRRRDDFINSDNQLNTIRAEQMALERKARQEALNRSYYDQPAEPTVAQQPAQMVDPASMASLPASRNPYDRRTMSQMDRLNAAYQDRMSQMDRMESLQDPRRLAQLEAMRALMPVTTFASPEDEQRLRNELGMPEPQNDLRAQQQQQEFLDQRKFLSQLINRPTPSPETAVSAAEALRPLVGRRVERSPEYENYLRTRSQPSIGADALGLAALLGGGNPFMR